MINVTLLDGFEGHPRETVTLTYISSIMYQKCAISFEALSIMLASFSIMCTQDDSVSTVFFSFCRNDLMVLM